MFRFVHFCIASLFVSGLPAQQVRGLVDETTRWEFVMGGQASVDSSIIRLGDIVRPLERDLAAWPRLSGATVGLMPIDGSPAQLSRDRLAAMIARGQATPAKITIHGPEQIAVHRQVTTQQVMTPVQTVDYEFQSDASPKNNSEFQPDVVDRVTQWTTIGLKHYHREIFDAFDVTVTLDAASIGTLGGISGVREMLFLDPAPVWTSQSAIADQSTTCRIAIDGRGKGESCRGEVTATFRPHRAIVVATRSMGRGTRLVEGDVIYQPSLDSRDVPSEPLSDEIGSPDEVVGMEVVSIVRKGIELKRSLFVAPRLIRRGDLLEVQVSGGGVRVTTAAKSMSDGAAGELIEIETIQPRRRLLARVLTPSLVEVMTQPSQIPRVTQ